ncbi:MAG: class I SAM-dependent methyltransferase [Clostridia bacterium]|nr:class I SAM-dependent methyltransferase [Clostridia bacterium]
MNKLWSTKIQSTEMLYYSRLERFNEQNCDTWFNLLKIKDGMRVLEVGCGGGHFTNMVKKHFPKCDVYGIDLDENHIKFAKSKCQELGLDVNYQVADINNLPFETDSFDVVFSHTVVEHLPFDNFIKEQRRVLKQGGHVVIMRVAGGKRDNPFMYLEDEIGQIFNKLDIDNNVKVGQYYEEPEFTLAKLNNYGFKNLHFSYDRFMFYCPDIQQDKEQGLYQIKLHHDMIKYNAIFNLQIAKNGEVYYQELIDLLDKQVAKRIDMYERDEKIFDYVSSLILTISATK